MAQRASVWCSPQVAGWLVEEHRAAARHADGSVLVEIPYASEDWLVRELLKHQGEAVLFEPVRLRATVAEMAERVLERYGTSRPKGGRARRAPTR
jgi:predicted DNA-binding transcriptional regulator YafY